MELFADQHRKNRAKVAPLAVRMRPETLDDFVGQEHFVGPDKLLRRMLQADRLTSAVFYGPPGSGKTTLANIIARTTRAHFDEVNAAAVGVKEIREILSAARDRLEASGRRSVLFVDELHRFNRGQQDVLLGDVEEGVVILLAATTQNPFFAINTPLLSRSQVFELQPLTIGQIEVLLRRAIEDTERGLGEFSADVTDDALRHLATVCDGDARRALAALEVAVLSQCAAKDAPDEPRASARADATGPITVTLEIAAESIQQKVIRYDAAGDAHYDAASALIKSIRGSDPDAAIYWLARMLEAGEDPRFLARRIVIAAAEDVGNAEPMALVLAQAAADATAFVGLPECQLPLAQAVIYLACAPKSNSATVAIGAAREEVRTGRTIPVPRHLRDAHYPGAARLGHGQGYEYPHDSAGGVVDQDYLGVERTFYHPTDRGHEVEMARYLSRFKALRAAGKTPDA